MYEQAHARWSIKSREYKLVHQLCPRDFPSTPHWIENVVCITNSTYVRGLDDIHYRQNASETSREICVYFYHLTTGLMGLISACERCDPYNSLSEMISKKRKRFSEIAQHTNINCGYHVLAAQDTNKVEYECAQGKIRQIVSVTTLLHEAINKRCYKIVKWLLKHGADPNLRDTVGVTALECALQYKGEAIYYARTIKIILLLIKHGALFMRNHEEAQYPIEIWYHSNEFKERFTRFIAICDQIE